MVRVFGSFDLLVGTLQDEEIFKSAMKHVSEMHSKLGVTTDIVKVFIEAISTEDS